MKNFISQTKNKIETINNLLSIDRWPDKKNELIIEDIFTILYELQPKKLGTAVTNNTISTQQ